LELQVQFHQYMQLSVLASRLVRTRVFKILAVVSAVFSIVLGSVGVHYYARYSRMIDQRLNGHAFETPAKIYDGSGKLLTTLSGEGRAKRRVVEFENIPKVLLDAVTAGEDQKFFNHHGLDLKRIIGAFIWNLHENHRLQGASTITQQLARSFFLNREPTLRRKISEAFIAVLLELRLTKEQIFTMYANEVYLGVRGLYAMHGFAEAAHSLFGKNLDDLTLAETATLAGITPAPNNFSPARHPDRALVRRDLILKAMRQLRSISDEDYLKARDAKIEIAQSTADTEAPYFLDFTRDELLKHYSEDEVMYGGYNVYTTLDAGLQRAAVDAIATGLTLVEKELAGDKKRKTDHDQPTKRPQAALIALDPHTGEIKAMVGGSDYNASQYNRITHAFRQPGSVFKPFVYAAALETGFNVGSIVQEAEATAVDASFPSIDAGVITPLTQIMDAPRTFMFSGMTYEPNNYKGGYGGLVTLRTALQKSLNSAAVQVAERIGYSRVADFAHRVGLNKEIRGYPSIALGAFEVTPIELAGAYTPFANEGRRVEPYVVRTVETPGGINVTATKPQPRDVIRPELAFLMTYLMEGVINRGTGAGVRARGFKLPAAGKTGTSRDGWFVGYTKDLLVIAWLGFDDNRDLGLSGSRSALPIWTEFMLKAYALYPPAKNMGFTPPPGIEFVSIDPETMMLATPDCTETFQEAFIRGTAPAAYCPLHSLPIASIDEPVNPGEPVEDPSLQLAIPVTIRAKPSDIR
jgi:penicillin-binding protein 1B